MSWDGQGGRNTTGPQQKNAGLRGLSALDVIIQGGYLPLGSGPTEYAAWLRAPVDYLANNLTAVVTGIVGDAVGDQLAPYIATVQAFGDAAQGADEHAEGQALAAQDFADAANLSATSAAASLASLLSNKATPANIRAGVEDTKFATSKGFADAGAFVASTGPEIAAGTVTFDMSLGMNRKHTMTVNTTVAAPTGMIDGLTYTWMFIAGAGFTMAALPAIFDFGIATAPVFNTAAGKINKIYGQYDATAGKVQANFWRQ